MSGCKLLVPHLLFSKSNSATYFRRANLIHPRLIETTTAAYPRKGWSEHFARVIEKELKLKPWCHTSTFEQPGWKDGVRSNFATDVRGNEVMRAYD